MFLKELWTELLGERLYEYPGYGTVLARVNELFDQGVWHFSFDCHISRAFPLGSLKNLRVDHWTRSHELPDG